MLIRGELDVAVLPSIDLPAFGSQLTVLLAGGLSASGPTSFAKIFSQVRPEQLTVLWADNDSRSAVALVQVLWHTMYRQRLSIIPFDATRDRIPPDAQAALLIGDRVVADPPIAFERLLDPVAMWFEMTGLPFVFGTWAALQGADCGRLYRRLRAARLHGQRHLEETAWRYAQGYDWPVDLAVRCLTREMDFDFTEDHREGLEEFIDLAADAGVIEAPYPLQYYRP